MFISTRTMAASLRIGIAAAFLASTFSTLAVTPAPARESNRTLKLYFAHTGERGEFTFKRNGRYDSAELERINRFLRDWRRDQPTKMDPALFDLIWAIYQKSGSHEDIHVVSAFRSLETNNMLRRRSKGVAKTSQHTAGKAMDFFLPDVPLARLRAIALKEQYGGVGYYPTSGSPFVHIDTGNVRHWPRMTRAQLLALFPDGQTIHIPSDGKPLPGYQRALALYGKGQARTQLAFAEGAPPPTPRAASPAKRGPGSDQDRATVAGWLSKVFADDGDTGDEAPVETARAPEIAVAQAAQTAQEATIVAATGETPRIPRPRPSEFVMAFADPSRPIPPADQPSLTELSLAPLPRPRPDDLAPSAAANTTQVARKAYEDDPIAALAARMSVETPSPSAPGLQVAMVEEIAGRPSPVDATRLASLMVATGDPTPLIAPPEARTSVASPAEARQVALELRREDSVPLDMRFTAQQEPALPNYSLDSESLRWIMSAQTTRTEDFAVLEMPKPGGAPDLYSAPKKAGEVEQVAASDTPRTDRFARADTAGGGFFQRLFGITR